MVVKDIQGHKILNSAGAWTIEFSVYLEDLSVGTASVPGGLSKGANEVDALAAEESLFILEELKDELINKDFNSTVDFDTKLIQIDGTPSKSKLGGNTMLALSVAFTKAIAKSQKHETYEYIHKLFEPEIPLEEVKFTMPEMMVLILEGGAHGSGDSTIQEFMAIVPTIERGIEIYSAVKKDLHDMGKSTNVGAEGAFSPDGFDNKQSLDMLTKHIRDGKIALDVAASAMPETANINFEELVADYPIASIEDPKPEDAWADWVYFASKHLSKIQVVTDDLTTTNTKLLREAINKNVGNAIIIKPNQIGTVYETLKVAKMAKDAGWKTIVSHRGTDTNDDFVSDLAIGINSEYVKFGAPARGERVAKYNRLLKIIESQKD